MTPLQFINEENPGHELVECYRFDSSPEKMTMMAMDQNSGTVPFRSSQNAVCMCIYIYIYLFIYLFIYIYIDSWMSIHVMFPKNVVLAPVGFWGFDTSHGPHNLNGALKTWPSTWSIHVIAMAPQPQPKPRYGGFRGSISWKL